MKVFFIIVWIILLLAFLMVDLALRAAYIELIDDLYMEYLTMTQKTLMMFAPILVLVLWYAIKRNKNEKGIR